MSTTTDSSGNEMITVPRAEFEELIKLKQDLPTIIEQAKLDERKDALVRLHQRDKENPEQHRMRSKRLYELKKEEIKAKRRESYRLKKEAAAAAKLPGVRSANAEVSPGPM
jgi:hypothetical protein